MKLLNQNEFDTLLARRVNLVAKTLQDIANTTDNNPTLMDQARFDKMQEFIGAHLQSAIDVITAAMNRPQPVALGAFTLGEPKVRKTRQKRAEKVEPAAGAEGQSGAVVTETSAPVSAPVADDELGDLEALLADEAA
ncbi:hypothetical protein [Magnetospirillum molischianum]|uniref:Uncharacterized protein n=1 Tax=Magnetospirillum molischianum DSM 120 TaxID=1150626 RepID=H8FY97_MAGML|nr:hypothetical protein [Magnetospirillum molischianum]CCG43335.1 hypothetical protein PHAMO_80126 [Magnetospirillum molischianum DSM 120]